MAVVDEEHFLALSDIDAVWRARSLAWSRDASAAEEADLRIIRIEPGNPDNFLGLGSVRARENRLQGARQSSNAAVAPDSNRVDRRLARGRALWAIGRLSEASVGFGHAVQIDLPNEEKSTVPPTKHDEPRHYLVIGMNTDLFNFADANHDGGIQLTSQWTSRWQTHVEANHYQRGAANADKAIVSFTTKSPRIGAITVGSGGGGPGQYIIPKAEVFFDYDNGWRLRDQGLFRGLEVIYDQHWYLYESARIATISEAGLLYLPKDWTIFLKISEARSQFARTCAEWLPAGIARVGFPVVSSGGKHLHGNIFFGVGAESFGQIDQVGHFASQTYGGTLHLDFTKRQDITGYAAYQKRTSDRSDTSFGLSYGIHF